MLISLYSLSFVLTLAEKTQLEKQSCLTLATHHNGTWRMHQCLQLIQITLSLKKNPKRAYTVILHKKASNNCSLKHINNGFYLNPCSVLFPTPNTVHKLVLEKNWVWICISDNLAAPCPTRPPWHDCGTWRQRGAPACSWTPASGGPPSDCQWCRQQKRNQSTSTSEQPGNALELAAIQTQ